MQQSLLDGVHGALLQQVLDAVVMLPQHSQLQRRAAQVVAAVDVEAAVLLHALLQRHLVAGLGCRQEAPLGVRQGNVAEDAPHHPLHIRVLSPAVLPLVLQTVVVVTVLLMLLMLRAVVVEVLWQFFGAWRMLLAVAGVLSSSVEGEFPCQGRAVHHGDVSLELDLAGAVQPANQL